LGKNVRKPQGDFFDSLYMLDTW